MADMTDLSIVTIIPLYNGALWIEQSVRSVFAQTLQPDEIIVVDDASTDGGMGASIVERIAKEHPNIRLLHKPNGGQSSARNFGVAHSKSALIAPLDQDDIWYPTHLEELVEAFRDHRGMRLGWAYSDFSDIDEDGRMVQRSYINPKLENPKRNLTTILRQGIIIQPSATLINREAFEAVGGFDERLCGYEDDDLFLRIFRARYDNTYVAHPTSAWRIHSSSCGASDRHDDSLRFYISKLLHTFPDDRWRGINYASEIIAPRFIKIWLVMYIRASRYNNHAKMREYVRDALALVPLLRARRRLIYSVFLRMLQFPLLGKVVIALHGLIRGIQATCRAILSMLTPRDNRDVEQLRNG
jgi:glycosyltransferase involved in cell wall biosynthesis